MLGVLGSAGAAICLAPCGSALGESNLGQAINAVTGTRLWAFVFSLPGTILSLFCLFVLRGCCDGGWLAIVQRFVHLSAHPQMMQQHCQLSRVATIARFFPFLPPRSASFRPQRLRSQSIPNGPRICCAPCTNSVRR